MESKTPRAEAWLESNDTDINDLLRALIKTEEDLAEARASLGNFDSKLAATEIDLESARTEIERLKNKNTASVSMHMWATMRHAFVRGAHKGYVHGTERRLLEQMFTEFCNKDYPEAVEKEIERFAEIERLQSELEHSIETSTALAALAIQKDKLIEQWRSVLEKLARLGNGDEYGNSNGNVIAQDALLAEVKS